MKQYGKLCKKEQKTRMVEWTNYKQTVKEEWMTSEKEKKNNCMNNVIFGFTTFNFIINGMELQ